LHRVDKFQPGYNLVLGLEGDLQPVGATLFQNKRPSSEVTNFALVAESVHYVTRRPVFELQAELSGHNLSRSEIFFGGCSQCSVNQIIRDKMILADEFKSETCRGSSDFGKPVAAEPSNEALYRRKDSSSASMERCQCDASWATPA
jgi:hypothetical protein